MKKTFYVKEGRKYVPAREYDDEIWQSFEYGASLVINKPGHTMTRHGVDPAAAPLIAAGMNLTDLLAKAISTAGELRLSQPATDEEIAAWAKIKDILPNRYYLEYPGTRDIAAEAVAELEKQAAKLMSNPAVLASYEQFMLVCKLTYEETKDNND